MSRWKGFVARLTRWAHQPEYSMGQAAMKGMVHYQEKLEVREAQLLLLEELFREKQGKISRLQAAYTAHKAPVYEDMRKEQPIKDAESLAQSITVLAQRADERRRRLLDKGGNIAGMFPHSDGTVQGLPGDRPNDPVGLPWMD